MKESERDSVLKNIRAEIMKKGMPIDIRTGDNVKLANWIVALVAKNTDVDVPLGTKMGYDYDVCPECSGVVGVSAYYCKHCGAYLRMVPK